MKKIGVDGCKGGWLAAVKDSTGKVRLEVYSTIGEFWQTHKDADCIAIDIPIGFRACEDGIEERRCDTEARKALGQPRGSSVFVVPCRKALSEKTYDEASRINFECTGRKLPVFTWAIMPKMVEVDTFLQNHADARKVFKEIHPEVCFWGLAGKRPMENNKEEWIGVEERISVMDAFVPDTRGFLLQETPNLKKAKAKASAADILDALAALVTIDGEEGSLRTLPDSLETDSTTGFPMSMAYRLP